MYFYLEVHFSFIKVGHIFTWKVKTIIRIWYTHPHPTHYHIWAQRKLQSMRDDLQIKAWNILKIVSLVIQETQISLNKYVSKWILNEEKTVVYEMLLNSLLVHLLVEPHVNPTHDDHWNGLVSDFKLCMNFCKTAKKCIEFYGIENFGQQTTSRILTFKYSADKVKTSNY